MASSRSRQALTLCAALLGVTLVARQLFDTAPIEIVPTSGDGTPDPSPERRPIAPDLATGVEDPVSSAETADAGVDSREEVVSPQAEESLPFGWVRLTATFLGRTPIASVYDATFVRDDRVGKALYPGPEQIPLSTGHWRGELRAAGYEAIPLPEFDVEEGKTTDLGSFVFEPGRARILGTVRSDSPGAGDGESIWIVDLYGGEVPTCEKCPYSDEGDSLPCLECGRIGDRWRREISPGASFAFTGLLSGRYRIHAHGPDSRAAGIEEWIELPRDGSVYTTLDVPATREVAIDLVDEAGVPFTGLREVDGATLRTWVRFRLSRDRGVDLTAAFLPDLPEGARREGREAIRLLLDRIISVEFMDSTTLGISPFLEPRIAPTHIDRPSTDAQSPFPLRSAAEGGDVPAVAIRRGGDPANRFRIAGLPPEIMVLTASGFESGSKPTEIDLRLPRVEPIRLVMKVGESPPEQELDVIQVFGSGELETGRVGLIQSDSIELDLRTILQGTVVPPQGKDD